MTRININVGITIGIVLKHWMQIRPLESIAFNEKCEYKQNKEKRLPVIKVAFYNMLDVTMY